MDIKEYIESGILEAYVLGALSESERAEVEANIALYPELAAEVAAIEESMLQFAEEHAETPPSFMKERIWEAVNENNNVEEQDFFEHKTIPLEPPPATKTVNWQRAAVWAAILVSVVTNFILLSQRNESREKQQELTAKVDSMTARQEELQNLVAAYKKETGMIADPRMETIVMRRKGDNNMAGMVYWSREKGEAWLALHNIPMPPQGKQYQLWVIQDGQPVDMGVIDNAMVSKEGMIMKLPATVVSGQAFAISLENEGGNPTPTEVYMVGPVPG